MENKGEELKKERPEFFYDLMMDRNANTVRIWNKDTDEDANLIVKGFYRDDFHISIANQWSTGDSSMVKSMVDRVAGLVTSRTGKMASHYMRSTLENDSVKGLLNAGGSAVGIDNAAGKASNLLNTMSNYQHASYFTADDFYKTFKGTTVTFPSSLQVTLMSDEYLYPNGNEDYETGKLIRHKKDVFTILKKILDISVGNYGAPEVLGNGSAWVGIQQAPNGFRTGGYDLKDILLEGSVRIHYGDPKMGGFVIKNMLVSNVHFTFSKTKVEVGPGMFRPLYIDVTMTLEPAKKFTKEDLIDTIGEEFKKTYYSGGELNLTQEELVTSQWAEEGKALVESGADKLTEVIVDIGPQPEDSNNPDSNQQGSKT